MEFTEEVSDNEKAIFKKKMKKLAEYKGSGTELITVYIPPETDRSSVMDQLTQEISQSSNIKDPKTRKNVQGALRRITNFLKQINFSIPKRGLVVFGGNVSEVEGKSDIRLFTVQPIRKLTVKLYWCDSEFHLAPLQEMIKPSELFGLLTIDKNEATIAMLKGKKYEIVGTFHSRVPGKIKAGGQCLSPDTLIQLDDGKIIEIKDSHNPLSVKSANFNSKEFEDSAITDKWENNKKSLLRIITKEPRNEIICSSEHVLFQVGEKNIEEVEAGKLNKNDFLVMPEKINIKGKLQKLDSNYFNSYIINKKGLTFLTKLRKEKKLSQKGFGKIFGAHQATVSAIELGKFNMRLDYLKDFCKKTGIRFEEFLSKYCNQNSTIKLPKKVTPGLAQTIGYLLGDGSIENERISFYERDKETADYYKKLVSEQFNAKSSIRFRESKNYYETRIYGKPIVRLIRNEFPEIKKSLDSKAPEKILKSPNKVVASFLTGLFDAEGYCTKIRLAMGMNNKKLLQQLQIILLRFGILASLYEYNNERNPYSNNYRYTLDITEKESLDLFEKNIGFTFKEKKKKLANLINSKSNVSRTRQLAVPGKQIRRMFEEYGLNTTAFPKVTNFFRNERQMSKQVFKNSIIKCVKNKELKEKFEEILNTPFIAVKIKEMEKINKKTQTIDISVKKRNFIANGLLVHNSAHRFERLREESEHDFYKKVSEIMDSTFTSHLEKLKGVLVGGPGITKNYFLNEELMDHRIRGKVIGKIDTSYTDESGVKEMVNKAGDILKDTEIVREKEKMQGFLGEVAKNGLAAYGEKEVLEALAIGKVEELLVSEDLDKMVYKFKCSSCGNETEFISEERIVLSEHKCEKCNSSLELLEEEVDFIDFLMEKANDTGAKISLISNETDEGKQFLEGFGGIGAFLRYK